MIKYQKDDFSKELLNKIKEMRIPQYISIKSLIIRSLISLSWVLLPYIIILNQMPNPSDHEAIYMKVDFKP